MYEELPTHLTCENVFSTSIDTGAANDFIIPAYIKFQSSNVPSICSLSSSILALNSSLFFWNMEVHIQLAF